MGIFSSSSLGQTTLPEYMREVHGDWLGNEIGAPNVPITGGLEVPAVFNSLMAAASPYNAYTYTDPTARIATVATQLSNYFGEVENIAAIRTNWDASLASAIAKVATELGADIATIQTLTATEWEDLDDQARVQLATLLNDTHINTVLAFFQTWTTIYAAAKAKADSEITDRSINVADRSMNIVDRSGNVSDRSGEVTDRSASLIDNSAAVSNKIDNWSTVYGIVLSNINSLFSITDYEISDADIAIMKTAYTGTINETYEKTLSEFVGGMAALNAINSSAFMIGEAMILRARDRDLSKFEADLILKNQGSKIEFQKDRIAAIAAMAQVYAGINLADASEFNKSLLGYEGYKTNIFNAYESFYKDAMIGFESQKKDAMVSYERQRAEAMIGYEILKKDLMISYEGLYARFIESMTKMNADIDNSKAQVGSVMQIAYENRREHYQVEALRGMIHMLVSQAQLRWQLAGQGTELIQKEHMFNTSVFGDYTAKFMEQTRISQVMDTEYEERELHLDVKDDLWDLSVFQYGANVLSAIGTGGGGYIPDGPSPVKQALGGALSGAALGAGIGSVVPGLGTAVGAGIGFILGGIGGFLE